MRRNVYAPEAENVTVVLADAGAENVVVPGPLTLDHDSDSELPVGKPSSVAVPTRAILDGNVIV